MEFGNFIDDFDDYEVITNDEKNEECCTVITEPIIPKPSVEILICPICHLKCEGSQELMSHYWGYCMKTRTYFDAHIDNWGVKI